MSSVADGLRGCRPSGRRSACRVRSPSRLLPGRSPVLKLGAALCFRKFILRNTCCSCSFVSSGHSYRCAMCGGHVLRRRSLSDALGLEVGLVRHLGRASRLRLVGSSNSAIVDVVDRLAEPVPWRFTSFTTRYILDRVRPNRLAIRLPQYHPVGLAFFMSISCCRFARYISCFGVVGQRPSRRAGKRAASAWPAVEVLDRVPHGFRADRFSSRGDLLAHLGERARRHPAVRVPASDDRLPSPRPSGGENRASFSTSTLCSATNRFSTAHGREPELAAPVHFDPPRGHKPFTQPPAGNRLGGHVKLRLLTLVESEHRLDGLLDRLRRAATARRGE